MLMLTRSSTGQLWQKVNYLQQSMKIFDLWPRPVSSIKWSSSNPRSGKGTLLWSQTKLLFDLSWGKCRKYLCLAWDKFRWSAGWNDLSRSKLTVTHGNLVYANDIPVMAGHFIYGDADTLNRSILALTKSWTTKLSRLHSTGLFQDQWISHQITWIRGLCKQKPDFQGGLIVCVLGNDLES